MSIPESSAHMSPLELLLELLEKESRDISMVSLSAVTERFLVHIEEAHDIDEHEIADFLVVASKLLLIKAQLLLPQFAPEKEEDDGPALADQLRLYQMFVGVSKHIRERYEHGSYAYERIEPVRTQTEFSPPENVTQYSLLERIKHLITVNAPRKPLPTTTIDTRITLEETIARLKHLLQEVKSFTFRSLLTQKENKTERIVSFLALLELAKGRSVTLTQENEFGEITISTPV